MALLFSRGFRWALGAVVTLLLPVTTVQAASHTSYFPTASIKLTVGDNAPIYQAFERRVDRGTVAAVYVWGVLPQAESACLGKNDAPPSWFPNQTALRVTVAPNIDEKGNPVYFPDGDREYLAILDRITQVGQTIEMRDGCRRAIAQVETDQRTNALGMRAQFPPRLFLETTPLGPVELRVRVYDVTDYGYGHGQTISYTPKPW